MIYAFAWDCYSNQPWLFVAKDEQEMLEKLKREFKEIGNTLKELKENLRKSDFGQGSRGGNFEIVTPREPK
jgi:hypothetical protein